MSRHFLIPPSSPPGVLAACATGTAVHPAGVAGGTCPPFLLRAAPRPATERVAVISGGGGGHEPFPTGYVAPGGLAAAIPGALFTSPPAAAVTAAAAALGAAGYTAALFVVLNYTGDRLSFGRAAAAVRRLRRRGEALFPDGTATVVVADDVALLPRLGRARARGIAGAVFVVKVAAAAAAAGESLPVVAAAARAAAAGTVSLGVALTSPSVATVVQGGGGDLAGRPPVAEGRMELGMGIHGERGASVMGLPPLGDLVDMLVDQLLGVMAARQGKRAVLEGTGPDGGNGNGNGVVGDDHDADAAAWPPVEVTALVNNLGGVPARDMDAITVAVVDALHDRLPGSVLRGVPFTALYAGTYLTALNSVGFSVSLLTSPSAAVSGWLAAATGAPAWGRRAAPTPAAARARGVAPLADTVAAGAVEARVTAAAVDADPTVVAADEGALRALLEAWGGAAPRLTVLDAAGGDGDMGVTLARGVVALTAALDAGHIRLDDPSTACAAAAAVVDDAMGGTSGGLLSLALEAAAGSSAAPAGDSAAPGAPMPLLSFPPLDAAWSWAAAVADAAEAVEAAGGARPGDRTAVDALRPAADALTAGRGVASAAAAARSGVTATARMDTARAGRAAYVGALSGEGGGAVDPGAEAVALAFEAVAAYWASVG